MPRTLLKAATAAAVLLSPALADAKTQTNKRYLEKSNQSDAWGRTSEEGQLNGKIKSDKSEAATLDTSLAATSFPMRAIVGNSLDSSWESLPSGASAPQQIKKYYAAKKCRFTIMTGNFTVRVHGEDEGSGFLVTKESVGPRSTVYWGKDETYRYSIVSDLGVQIDLDTEDVCKKVFGGKRVRFARVSLEGSKLVAASREGEVIKAEVVQPADLVDLYLSWDKDTDNLKVVDRAGAPLQAVSPVFALTPKKDGVSFLAFEPVWKADRKAVTNLTAKQ